MKQTKPLFFILLFLNTVPLFSQKSFLDSGKLWKVSKYIWAIEQTTELVSVNPNDTQTINGKTYFKFQNYWIREENQKVFFCKNNQDYPLYDFSLNVGDSFTSYSNHSLTPYLFRVDSKRKIKFKNGVDSIIYQEIKCLDNPRIRNIQIIEGLGAINSHPVNAYMMFEAADIMIKVSCFLYNEKQVLYGLVPNFQSCCYDEDILNTSNIWYIYESDDNGDTKYGSTIFPTNIDTTINNKSYRIIKFNKNNIFIRKDSNKYYQYLDSWSPEILLYKENAKVGDTIQFIDGLNPLIVDSIKIKLVGKNLLKYYYTKNDIIIGGIGNVNQVFFQKRKYIHMEYLSGNVCFNRNLCNIFFNQYPESSKFKDCNLGLNIIDNLSKFNIYPTYTNDFIHIERNDFTPIDIKIFDLLGNCILTKTSSLIKETVNLKNISPGFYFLNIGSYKTKIYKF